MRASAPMETAATAEAPAGSAAVGASTAAEASPGASTKAAETSESAGPMPSGRRGRRGRALRGGLSDGGDRRAAAGGCRTVHRLPDDRTAGGGGGGDTAGVGGTDFRVRSLPGGLPVQQPERSAADAGGCGVGGGVGTARDHGRGVAADDAGGVRGPFCGESVGAGRAGEVEKLAVRGATAPGATDRRTGGF